MAKKEMDTAEQYREERKARLAKASKKKGSGGKGASKIFGKLIAILLVLAFVAGAGWLIVAQSGVRERTTVPVTVGEAKVNTVVYRYYYTMFFESYYKQVAQLVNQLQGMNPYGYDLTKAPSEQEYTLDDEDEGDEPKFKMWSDYFQNMVLEMMHETYTTYAEAIKIKEYQALTEDEQKEVDKVIEDIRTEAAQVNFSVNAYLRETYGKGFTEKVYRDQMKIEMIVRRYTVAKEAEMGAQYSEDVLRAEYEKTKDSYDVMSFRQYSLKAETLTKKDGESDDALKTRQTAENDKAKKQADELLAKASDEKTFLAEVAKLNEKTKDYDADSATAQMRQSVENASAIGEDAVKWLFDAARKVGDKQVFGKDGSYDVLYVTATRYAPYSADVRHLLVSFIDESAEDHQHTEDETATQEQKDAAKKTADDLYAQWQQGDKTEESFAALAKEKTDDTASAEDGGLYADIKVDANLVVPFLNWVQDPARKVGDTDIVETEYGYHIMYFVKDGRATPDYLEVIKTEKVAADYDAYIDGLMKTDAYKQNLNQKSVAWSTSLCEKWIKERIAQSAQA